jgi:beta-N-acetylhexosaminidase
MLSSTPFLFDPVWTYLVSSMKEDEEFRRTVRNSARRILETKLRYLRGEQKAPYIPDLERVRTQLPDPEGAAFFLNLAARSVTIVKPAALPLNAAQAGRVLLVGQYGDFFRAGRAAFPNARTFSYSTAEGAADITPYARDTDTIIFCLANAADLRVLRSLEWMRKNVIVLSVLSPALLDSVPWISGAVAVYSYAWESFAAGFTAIIGRIPAEGRLPYE